MFPQTFITSMWKHLNSFSWLKIYKKCLGIQLSNRVLALHIQGPDFEHCQQNKFTGKKYI